jgi:hypothetical protein
MHPELALVVHRQRERELDAELRRRLAIREREVLVRPAAPARPQLSMGIAQQVKRAPRRARPTFLSSPTVCCAAA